MPTFFHDQQIRRYILQFQRIFADFKIQLAPDENGTVVEKRVPIVYGNMSRQVAQILKDNSANTTLVAPMMSGYIVSLEPNAEQRRDTTGISPVRAIERQYDPATQTYSSEMGNRYMIERYMPVPYKLTMNLDIWTNNTTDKLQLMEQIMVIFNPSVQLQTNDNPLDFSSIFEVELVGTTWSNKGIPIGTDLSNDIATFTFEIPIWINAPAKVKRQKIVEQIVMSIYDVDLSSVDKDALDPFHSAFTELDQFIITPGNHRIEVTPIDSTTSQVELLDSYGNSDPTLSWDDLAAAYGKIDPDTTTLRLKTVDDIEDDAGDVLGSLEVSNVTTNLAIFTVDTDSLPTTIASSPVNAIIDPRRVYPGSGLPSATVGQRYLLVSDDNTVGNEHIIAQNTNGINPWGSIEAYESDIIEYTGSGSGWVVVFDSSDVNPPLYITNTDDGQHYKYDGSQWTYTYLGVFNPGYWRIEI